MAAGLRRQLQQARIDRMLIVKLLISAPLFHPPLRGQRVRARTLLGPVFEQFTEGFDTVDLAAAKSLLSTLN